mmetsp:Transcript_6200/g.15973  ORF Transcript_6200/g.15973 Transcript_6200/m.15973 type:complete len:268 (-) Transcript_6200:364-1167(-)
MHTPGLFLPQPGVAAAGATGGPSGAEKECATEGCVESHPSSQPYAKPEPKYWKGAAPIRKCPTDASKLAGTSACGVCVSMAYGPARASMAATNSMWSKLPPPRSSLVPSHGHCVVGSLALPQVYGPGVELHTRVPLRPSMRLSRHMAARSPAFHRAIEAGLQSTAVPLGWCPQIRVQPTPNVPLGSRGKKGSHPWKPSRKMPETPPSIIICAPSSHFSTPHEPAPPSKPYTGRGTGMPLTSLKRHSAVWFIMYALVAKAGRTRSMAM